MVIILGNSHVRSKCLTFYCLRDTWRSVRESDLIGNIFWFCSGFEKQGCVLCLSSFVVVFIAALVGSSGDVASSAAWQCDSLPLHLGCAAYRICLSD